MLKLSGWSRLTWGRVWGRPRTDASGSRGSGSHGARRCLGAFQPPIAATRCAGNSYFNQPRAAPTGGHTPLPPPPPNRVRGRSWWGATLRDTQADVPSARGLRAQLAFKDSMVHGILQFTPSIAFRYVLHRCESRDIRCRESFCFVKRTTHPARWPSPVRRGTDPFSFRIPWRVLRRGCLFVCPREGRAHPASCRDARTSGPTGFYYNRCAGRSAVCRFRQ